MRKVLHKLIILIFALTGVSFVFSSFGFAWHIRTLQGPYFQSEVDLFQAIAFFLASFGIYRFDRRVRGFVIFLAAFSLLASFLGLLFIRSVWMLGFAAAWLFVLAWLLSSSTKAQFFAPSKVTRTA